MSAADISDRLREVLEPVITRAELYLEEISVAGAGNQRHLRVVVDLPDGPGGVSSDALGEVSRDISAQLDADADLLPGPYLLEVTTPGISRPLTEPRHFRRAQGRLVSLTTPSQTLHGRVTSADADGLRLQPQGKKSAQAEPVLVPWPQVRKGRIEVEFNRPKDSGG